MGRGAEAGKADDSVDTDASTAPKMSGETGDAPSASETTESHGGRPPSGAGASTSFENGQKGVHRPGLVRRLARSIPMVGDLFLPSDGRFGDGAFDMRIRPARGRTSPSTDEGTEKGTFRERVSSFSSLLNVQKVSQKVSDTLEQQIGRFGPAGIEIYRFAWQRFNRRVAFHIAFYSVLGSVLFVLWALAAWQLWLVMGLWAFRRFILMLGVVVLLAMLPPSFPNAAAHGLSLALVAAELCLLGVNLVLFGLVHLAVLLNKYILPHWFHRGLTVVNEISSGVIDHDGRARSVMTGERNKLLARLFHCESYRQWLGVASQLDKLPTDLGEGGDEWRKDEARSSDAYDAALCKIYLTVMRQARGSGDAAALGLSLRTVLHRNFGGQLRGNERGKERIWEQQPETTRPELQAPKKQRKDSMCIAPATKAYKAPGARTATAFVQPPTPTFAVVAPPKRFDATASDARWTGNALLGSTGAATKRVLAVDGGALHVISDDGLQTRSTADGLILALASTTVSVDDVLASYNKAAQSGDANDTRSRVNALRKALGELHTENGSFAVIAFDAKMGRVLAARTKNSAPLSYGFTADGTLVACAGLTAQAMGLDASLDLTSLPSGRFIFGHRYVKPIEFTQFWSTAQGNRAAAPARKARRSVDTVPENSVPAHKWGTTNSEGDGNADWHVHPTLHHTKSAYVPPALRRAREAAEKAAAEKAASEKAAEVRPVSPRTQKVEMDAQIAKAVAFQDRVVADLVTAVRRASIDTRRGSVEASRKNMVKKSLKSATLSAASWERALATSRAVAQVRTSVDCARSSMDMSRISSFFSSAPVARV